VEYIATDPGRQTIPWVRITRQGGDVTEFRASDFKDDPAKHTLHVMDCTDCHNRPAHQFRSPDDAVDLALYLGTLSTNLPSIKKEVIMALTGATETQEEGLRKVAESLRKAYPNRSEAELNQTVATAQNIYRQNFFPQMKVDWR